MKLRKSLIDLLLDLQADSQVTARKTIFHLIKVICTFITTGTLSQSAIIYKSLSGHICHQTGPPYL